MKENEHALNKKESFRIVWLLDLCRPLVIFASLKESRHSPQIPLAQSWIPGAEQNSLIGFTLALPGLLKLACCQKPIPDTFKSFSVHTIMSLTWLYWRKPMHNLRIFVWFKDGVETIFEIPTIDILVAYFERDSV